MERGQDDGDSNASKHQKERCTEGKRYCKYHKMQNHTSKRKRITTLDAKVS
jgi:hypothetical protein